METTRKVSVTRRAFCMSAAFAAVPAFAQTTWPNKPLRIIANFPAGSSPDVLARAVATPLSKQLGTPVVVENRAGAGGFIGAQTVAKAPADGYTVLMSSGSTVSILPHISPNLDFSPDRDLTPLAAGVRIELFLLARSELPFKDFEGLLKYAKANPGKLKYASPGNGTAPHLAGEMLKAAAGIQALHVPYKGSSPALQDLLGGQVDFAFDPGVGLAHVEAGKLRMLAVGGGRRVSRFSNVPTIEELGLKGFDAGTTHGFYAPRGVPATIAARLHEEINSALRLEQVRSQIVGLGAQPSILSVDQFVKVTKADSQRFAAAIKALGITADS